MKPAEFRPAEKYDTNPYYDTAEWPGYIEPTGTIEITENGEVDVTQYAKADVSVEAGGGGGVTVEALTATENKTYTAPSGKAYSPVTVNVSGGGTHAVVCKLLDTGTHTFTDMESLVTQTEVGSRGRYAPIGAYINSATTGDVLYANADESGVGALSSYGTADSENVVISIGEFKGDEGCFVMPDSDVVVVYTS